MDWFFRVLGWLEDLARRLLNRVFLRKLEKVEINKGKRKLEDNEQQVRFGERDLQSNDLSLKRIQIVTKRMAVICEIDRIHSLPAEILQHILSFLIRGGRSKKR
eukprot:TRINITY_DN8637_c0_g2_i1.p1 TRINITY_DN8637_c0_g2~~TRINITY_DN8637_c0_g2_i1.p1  ORF type:complete len:104 (+),score=2.55 TRINITY_DN8637_c0_g2_i1:93-404(+)